VGCLVLPQISTLSYKWQHFREGIIKRKVYVWTFSETFSEIFLVLKGIQQDITINAFRSVSEVSLFLLRF